MTAKGTQRRNHQKVTAPLVVAAQKVFVEFGHAAQMILGWFGAIFDISRPVADSSTDNDQKARPRPRNVGPLAVMDHSMAQAWIRPDRARHQLYKIWAAAQRHADFTHQINALNKGRVLSSQRWGDTKTAARGLSLSGVATDGYDGAR